MTIKCKTHAGCVFEKEEEKKEAMCIALNEVHIPNQVHVFRFVQSTGISTHQRK